MAIDFPNSPSTNDTYTVNGRTYIWNGEKWLRAQPELTSVVPTLTVSNDFAVDTDTLHVDSTNDRVGIGTTSPAKKLHVKGDDEGIRIEDGSATDHYDIYRNDTTGHLEFTGSQTSFSGYDFEVNNGTNVMRIANSGNVGIGTTSPAEELHILKDQNGDLTQVLIENLDQRVRIGSYYEAGVAQYGKIQSEQDAGGNVALALNPEGGNVGIGTASPANTLHVDSGSTDQFAAPQIYVAPSGHASSDRAAIQLDDIQLLTDIAGDGTEDFSIYSNNAAAHRLSIDGSGNVGIGTYSPSTTLHVDGSILANDSVTIGDGGDYVAGSIYSDANWGMIFRAKQASPAQADFRWANSADTERMRIDSSGNVGINDTTPSYPLDVNGDINAQGYARSKGKKLGMALLHEGSLGGGVSTFLNQFNADWKNYRIVVDATQNGSTTWTYFRFVDSSNTAISSGYYTAYWIDGVFSRQNGQSAAVGMFGGYHAYGGMVMDITLPYTGDNPSFHISSAGHNPTSTQVYSLMCHGYCVTSLDITGFQFYNGSPYGSVKVYGY